MKKNESGETYVQIEVNFFGSSQQSQKYKGNTNGMWIIDNLQITQGGIVEWGQPFYLR